MQKIAEDTPHKDCKKLIEQKRKDWNTKMEQIGGDTEQKECNKLLGQPTKD